ncbi:MAG: MarR family winged helix-turn-helix transcriptional regulator [Dehalococcoidia bacterium]
MGTSEVGDAVERALRLYGRAMSLADPARSQLWDELRLTMSQLRIVFFLRREPAATAGTLAAQLRVTLPTVTGIADRLVRQGLVLRQEDPNDRRLVRHCLTERGLQVVGELERTGRVYMETVLQQLTPLQLERLTAALEDLCRAAEMVEGGVGSPSES